MDYDSEDSDIKLKQVDYLRDKCEISKPVDYDDLKRGDCFLLQKNCPACNSAVVGRKEYDFQCQNCYVIFRYEKK